MKKKTVIALILTALFCISLSACGGSAENAGSVTPPPQQEESAPVQEEISSAPVADAPAEETDSAPAEEAPAEPAPEEVPSAEETPTGEETDALDENITTLGQLSSEDLAAYKQFLTIVGADPNDLDLSKTISLESLVVMKEYVEMMEGVEFIEPPTYSDSYVEPEPEEPPFISRPWPVDTFVDETLNDTAKYLLSVLPDETFAFDLRPLKNELRKIEEAGGIHLYVRDDKDVNPAGFYSSSQRYPERSNAEAREFIANYVKNFDPSYLFAEQFPPEPENWDPYEIYYDWDYVKDADVIECARENWQMELAILSFSAIIDEDPTAYWHVREWQYGELSDAGLKNFLDWSIASRGIYSTVKITVQ